MKKETGSKIPEAYWQTEAGQKIAAAMHSDGWDASDCLGSVIDLLDEGIAATSMTGSTLGLLSLISYVVTVPSPT